MLTLTRKKRLAAFVGAQLSVRFALPPTIGAVLVRRVREEAAQSDVGDRHLGRLRRRHGGAASRRAMR
jgi:hypothetical protein